MFGFFSFFFFWLSITCDHGRDEEKYTNVRSHTERKINVTIRTHMWLTANEKRRPQIEC
jgi:hypothetical protein